MLYADLNNATFDITLTLGDVDTTNPPLLRLVYNRKGTNETGQFDPLIGEVYPGDRFVTVKNIPTTIFAGSGQYNYKIYDIDVPANPVLIESGFLEVITDDPIIKTEYGTDKERGEYKGHI